jgi:CubicO group peptidase (beta-lactamase class C family)
MDQKRIRELEHTINTDYGNTTGVVVLKEGKLVYEKYFKGCTRESQVHVFSVTKSIISILIGIAVDKGYIESIDQKVLDFFPEYVVRKRENTIPNITVKDMLTMTVPYKYRFFPPYVKYFTYGGLGEVLFRPARGPGEDRNIPICTSDWSGYSFRNISKSNRAVGI